MHRKNLKTISKLRRKEAKILLDNGALDGAFYLLGYSIECALKACIAKNMQHHVIPEKKFINDIYSHNLDRLLDLSGLKKDFENDCKTNPNLAVNWAIVKDWSEESRYEYGVSPQTVRDFYGAVSGRSGVLVWLKKRW